MNAVGKTSVTSKAEAAQATDHKLQELLGYHLRRASAVVQMDLQHALEPFGLRMMTFTVLSIVSENPNNSQSRLSQKINNQRSGAVPLIDELEGVGLVGRHRVEGDRRSYALRLTSLGEKTWKSAFAAVQQHEHDLFASACDTDVSEIKKILKQIWRA